MLRVWVHGGDPGRVSDGSQLALCQTLSIECPSSIYFLHVYFVILVIFSLSFLKKNQNAPRPSEHPPVRRGKMSKRLGGIKGCKYKTSSWHLNGFPYGGTIGSTV